MFSRRGFAFGCIFLFLAASLHAGDPERPRFTIETPARVYDRCTLHGINKSGIEADDGGPRFQVARFLQVRRCERPLPPFPARNFVFLTSGDRIPLDPGAAAVLEGNRLQIWPAKASFPAANANGLSLYVPTVAFLFWSLPLGVDDEEVFFTQLAGETRKRDVVFLKNGDRIEGTLMSLAARTGSVMAVGDKRIETPWAKLAGCAWNTDLQVRPRARTPFARAILADGARVSIQDLRFDGKSRTFSGKNLFGAPLEWKEESLLALDMRQDIAVELSGLTPIRYIHEPYLGASWPLAKDAAATGRPLRLGGSVYEKGIGTHAPCRVVYKLDGAYQRFDALAGIDDASRAGRARLALELDGKRIDLGGGKEFKHGDAPLRVRQDVRNVRELVLIVELGSFGDVQANVNWAEARLIKKE